MNNDYSYCSAFTGLEFTALEDVKNIIIIVRTITIIAMSKKGTIVRFI